MRGHALVELRARSGSKLVAVEAAAAAAAPRRDDELFRVVQAPARAVAGRTVELKGDGLRRRRGAEAA